MGNSSGYWSPVKDFNSTLSTKSLDREKARVGQNKWTIPCPNNSFSSGYCVEILSLLLIYYTCCCTGHVLFFTKLNLDTEIWYFFNLGNNIHVCIWNSQWARWRCLWCVRFHSFDLTNSTNVKENLYNALLMTRFPIYFIFQLFISI